MTVRELVPSRTWLRSITKGPAGSGMTRLATLPISLVCGVLSVRLMIEGVGTSDFGLISLLVTAQFILPFMDLGTSAAVLEAGARQTQHGDVATLALRMRIACRTTLLTSSALLGLVGLAAAAGGWPDILGRAGATWLNSAVLAIIALNAVTRPLNVCLSALIGLGRATSVVLLQVAVPITSLGVVFCATYVPGRLLIYSCSVLIGQLVCGIGAAVLLNRCVPNVLRTMLHVREPREGEVDALGGRSTPMFLINVMSPLGIGLDRLILNHLSTPLQLSTYAVGAQIFQSAGSVIITVQLALWADLSRRRARADPHLAAHIWRLNRWLAAAGVAGGLALSLVAPVVVSFASSDSLQLSTPLLLTLVAIFACTLALAGPAASLTSPRGLRTQATIVCGSLVLNLGITVGSSAHLGALGPALGSLAGVVVQLVAFYFVLVRSARSLEPDDRMQVRP